MHGTLYYPRHCERSEAIHAAAPRKNGLLRRFAPRNDVVSLKFQIADTRLQSRDLMRPRFA
jgi:hypothetical protein